AAMDDAVEAGAVLGHAIEDEAGVHGGAFDGGEELVLGGVVELPAEGDAAEIRVDQHGAVAVVPAQAQQAGLSGAIVSQPMAERGNVGSRPARDRLEDVAGG